MNSKLVLISALLCVVAADVSEILRRPHSSSGAARLAVRPAHHQRPSNYRLQGRQDEIAEEALFDNAFIPDTAADHDDSAALEQEAVPFAFQLPESHPDFQGPYHYDTPAVTADYLPPVVVVNTKNPDVDYLPPLSGPRDVVDEESQPAKRSTKLRIRVRHH